ncbi:serine/threonine-protein kinase [Coraliomargarita algicola]|uniref:Serine/threonine-protein kinase n=1 Tax=Coraliomargarita algicola TaxID=3092156 RepID=A0ABZ0RNS7_9BACT|nr:serine/threonine-protein kinase [Coraliomargarita sp. J2-16]WPJ97068.1 serine/threonine-protein kinase [Coraliomargarita sp. J2-16]
MSSEDKKRKPASGGETDFSDNYVPDQRLSAIFSEAHDLELHGLEGLCPAYSELAAVEVRYRDESLIGEGSVKEVYRIYDEHLRRWVAMARLRPDRGPDFYDLFIREARLVATLTHPNIIKVQNMGVWDDGRPFFTMDLKGKTTFADTIQGTGSSHLHTQLQILGKVCDAIAYAHSRGVLHLDLKPDNIQVDDFGEVLVCDWGLGKLLEEAEFEEDGAEPPVHIWGDMTLTGQIKGSPGYMAPEQVVAGLPKDHRTDVYALGCLLHCMLTGQPPFIGEREIVLAKTVETQVPSLRLEFPERSIPAGLEAVVLKATAKDPAQRYQSVSELQQDIQNYLAGFATLAEQPGFFREARLFVARNRVPVAIVVVALLVIGVTSVLFVQGIARHKLAIAAERGRAEQLSSEVETLDSEYGSFVEQAQLAKQELAKQLALSARELRNLAIFDRPVATVRRTRFMVNTALQQDPDCIEAHAQHYATDCVELNYTAALKRRNEVRTVAPYGKYILFAQAFPDFNFSDKKRPSISQLVDFFEQARQIDNRLGAYFERVLAYDVVTRKRREGYEAVVEAYLQYRYGGPDHLTLSLDTESSSLSLWSDQLLRLNGQYGGGLLRFLTFSSLTLDFDGRFPLSDLNGLLIESLDLSQCQEAVLNKAVSLPALKTIVCRPEQFPETQLRRLIQANEAFKVVYQK